MVVLMVWFANISGFAVLWAHMSRPLRFEQGILILLWTPVEKCGIY
jgi:hypothetical protein